MTPNQKLIRLAQCYRQATDEMQAAKILLAIRRNAGADLSEHQRRLIVQRAGYTPAIDELQAKAERMLWRNVRLNPGFWTTGHTYERLARIAVECAKAVCTDELCEAA